MEIKGGERGGGSWEGEADAEREVSEIAGLPCRVTDHLDLKASS